MNISMEEARMMLKNSWKEVVLNYSDTANYFTSDQIKKKIKQLNKIIEEMGIEEIMEETLELQEFVKNFNERKMV